jgi:hypothetical protein
MLKICIVLVLAIAAAGCFKSPTAPDPTPHMLLNPDLQGIA